MNTSFSTNRQFGPMFPFAYKFPQSFESTHQFSTTVPFRTYAPQIHHQTYSQSAMARNLSPHTVPKKKNSFTIEAILGIDSSKSDQVAIRDEELLYGATMESEKRTNRLCSYPFPTVTGDTHINDNEMKHCLNYEEKPAKSKRVRTIFTTEQLERLESEFERQQYMVGPERLFLASTLRLKEAQVKVWFQNRRIKWRKDNHEIQQARLAELRSDGDEQQLD